MYLSAIPEDNAQAFDFNTPTTENKTLYAIWTQGFIITFNTLGGTIIERQIITQGGTITKPTNDPAREHYNFDDWYTTAETGGQSVTFPCTVNESIVFYARWTQIQFNITFDLNYTDATNIMMTVNSGETVNKPETQPTRELYTFGNWYSTKEATGQPVSFPFNVTESKTFYALWNRISFTITFNPNYTGAQTSQMSVNSGEMAIPLTPEPTRTQYYPFLNWHENTSET